MSDYLTRLAERVTGAVEAIRPRVPYRFERPVIAEPYDGQLTRTGGPSPPQDRATTAPLGPRARVRTPPASRPTGESPRDVVRPLRSAPGAKTSIVPGEAPPEPARTETVARPASEAQAYWTASHTDIPLSSTSRQQDGPASSPIDDRRRRVPSPRTAEPDATDTGTAPTSSPIPLEHLAASAAAVGHRPATRLDESRPVIGPRDDAHPVVRPKDVVRRKEEAHPVVRPRDIVRRRDGDRHDDLRRAGSDVSAEGRGEQRQEPVVVVTIGRVEVRAVAEPPKAPARPRRAARSAMSLDEYLTRHEARRR
jgi:hypothetical protein